MSRFCSKEEVITYRFSEGDDSDETVDFFKNLPFSKVKEIFLMIDQDSELKNVETFIPLLRMGIKSWNMADVNGVLIPFSTEKIMELDSSTVIELASWYMPKIMPNKKKATA